METNSSDKVRELRERRIRLAEEKENRRKRSEVGPSVVEKVNTALGSRLVLGDFDAEESLPIQFDREPNFRDCSGLVAAHSSEDAIREIASCCDAISGLMSGSIGFDEYAYLGTARVQSVTLTSLLDAARAIHDSIMFCPDGSDSIVLLDHYRVSGIPRDEGFSFIVQGGRLESEYADCFAG